MLSEYISIFFKNTFRHVEAASRQRSVNVFVLQREMGGRGENVLEECPKA